MKRRFELTPYRRRIIIAATIAPLRPFRKGYARDKSGPFFRVSSIEALLKAGCLRRDFRDQVTAMAR